MTSLKNTKKTISNIHRFFNKLILGTELTPKLNRNLFKEEVDYLKKIWNNSVDKDFGIERLIKLFLSASRFVFPGLYVRIVLNRYLGYLAYRVGIEVYVIIKLFLPIVFFINDLEKNPYVVIFVAYMMIETFLYLLSKVYFGHLNQIDEVYYLRHLTLSLINFIEINLSFGILYSYFYQTIPHFLNIPKGQLSNIDIIYFSFITSGTVGYGDIYPIHSFGKFLTIIQILLFFLFVTIIINHRQTKINNKTVTPS